MIENQFDLPAEQPASDNILNETQDPGTPLSAPRVAQPALFSDKKNQPVDYLNSRQSAGLNYLHNRLPEPKSYEDFMAQNEAVLSRDPLYGTGARTPGVYKESVVRRYDDQEYGFIPGGDMDDFYGKRESWLETTGKGLGRIIPYTGVKVLEGIGFTAGLLSPWNYFGDEGVVSNAADNTLAKWASEMDDELKNEWMPTFQEAADREKGFWNRFVTDGDFWAEDFVDGAAFALSAFIPGMALSKLGLGARAMTLAGRMRYGVGAAEAAVQGASSMSNYFTKAQTWGKGLDKFNTWAIATASESMFEATEVRNKVRDSLRETGLYTEQEINKIAGEAARNSFLMNSALLGVTNLFQYKYMAKMFGMGEKALSKGSIRTGLGLADEAVLEPAESLYKTYFKGIGGSILREGYVEENMQLAIQRINEEYGIAGRTGAFLSATGDVFSQYIKQTGESLVGDDKEAATNIGLGGIIGGGMSLLTEGGIEKDKRKAAENALKGFTRAQNSWLKFGDIFQTEQVEDGKDENGNVKYKTRTVLDDQGNPVVDDNKVAAILTGVSANAAMLSDAEKVKNKEQAEYLRMNAFADFVLAHVNAKSEDTLLEKLDALKTAKPEDLAKLGFVVDENLDKELAKYKSIAADILKQSEIIENSILNDGSEQDQMRMAVLRKLGAQQVLARQHASKHQNDLTEFKNRFITPEMTSLSDGLVDQLNELQLRIRDQKQLVDDIEKRGSDMGLLDLYKRQLKELQDEHAKLETDNEQTLKLVKKDSNNFYNYEKADRNDEVLNNIIARRGQYLNDIKNSGYQWAFFADNKNGKKNYADFYEKLVAAQQEQIRKEQEEEDKKAKEKKEAEEKAAQADVAGSQAGDELADTDEDFSGAELDDAAAEELGQESEKSDIEAKKADIERRRQEEIKKLPEGTKSSLKPLLDEVNAKYDAELAALENKTASKTGKQSAEKKDPGLDNYLLDKYNTISEAPGFNMSFKDWRNSKDGQYHTKQYYKQFGQKPEAEETAGTDLEKQIDELDLADTKLSAIAEIQKKIRELIGKIADNEELAQKLIDKINQIKDAVVRAATLKLMGPVQQEEDKSLYIPLSSTKIVIKKAEEHKLNKINVNYDEATGFVIRDAFQLINNLEEQSELHQLNGRVRVQASRKYVQFENEKVQAAAIPNRTMITYETPSDIEKLKKGESVIAVSSRNKGFATQIYYKNQDPKNHAYVAGIENFAIVHPDNSTEQVTFSEAQREFVKQNMFFKGKDITDEVYDNLRDIYEKVQLFNREVELAMGDNIEMDITPIFDKYFTLTYDPKKAEKGAKLKDALDVNTERLFPVQVQTTNENGEVQTKTRNAGLVASKYGNNWKFYFDLAADETLVEPDEASGELIPVSNIKEYLKKVHGIEPNFNDLNKSATGGTHINFWIARDNSSPRGHKPYGVRMEYGTEPRNNFRGFAKDIIELKSALETGAESGKFTYQGKDYPNAAALIKYFNINKFGFDRVGSWFVNFSFNPKTKSFVLEFRPSDRTVNLTDSQKKALNLYISTKELEKVDAETTDDQLLEIYNDWTEKLNKSFEEFVAKKIANDADPVVKPLAEELKAPGEGQRSSTLFYFTAKNNQLSYFLKLRDRSPKGGIFSQMIYESATLSPKVLLNLNNKPEAKPAPKPAVTSAGLTVLGDLTDNDTLNPAPQQTSPKKKIIRKSSGNEFDLEGGAAMLKEEDSYKAYTQTSFQQELQWLAKNLPAGIQYRDLGTIIDKLGAGKQILGYYKDRAVYVSQSLSAEGTVYHEAFHALFRDIMTADQRAFYIRKAKGKIGKISATQIEDFRNERGYTNKSNAEIENLIAEEYLADGFRSYKLDKKEPADSWFKKFVKTLERIINFFTGNKDAINALYEQFDNGAFAAAEIKAPSSISQEGVFALAYGRPRLISAVDDSGEVGFEEINNIPLKPTVQSEVVNKLVYYISNDQEGTFEDKLNRAVAQARIDYDIDNLTIGKDEETAQKIRDKYGDDFNEALYVLGEQTPYSLDSSVANDEDANSYRTEPGSHLKTFEIIKKEIKGKIERLGIDKPVDRNDYSLPLTEEEREESNRGGEFDQVFINPLEGLSREFRSLFSMIPYKVYDSDLDITVTKMADGNKLFNAMMKIAANKSPELMIPSLVKAVDNMTEDNDPNAGVLNAFVDFISDKFGIERDNMGDVSAKPTRNLFLYMQFLDTFFVSEMPNKIVKLTTDQEGSKAEIFDASINQDQKNKKEAIAYFYNRAYKRLTTQEQKDEFAKNFRDLQEYINQSLKDTNSPANRKALNKQVNELKSLMDKVNLVLPKGLIRQSLVAYYHLERNKEYPPNSNKNRQDLEADQALMKEGAYLQWGFFDALARISEDNYANLFSETKSGKFEFGKDTVAIGQFNSILKKATKYIIKYDINSAISVHENAEHKNVYRYTRYTPPMLLAQLIREKGIDSLSELYPVLSNFFADNPLFDGSLKNQLLLSNLMISSFGGIRQVIENQRDEGVTFGSIDPKAFILSGIVNFLNRTTISSRMKNNSGRYEDVSITTFERSRTQEEATTTNFLVTAGYKKYSSAEKANKEYFEDLFKMLKQEYNRIAREWASREDGSVVRYKGYNENLHPVTKEPITGDSYVVDGKTVRLRAYEFENFKHFFDQQKTEEGSTEIRQDLKEKLREAAKSGISFEEAMKIPSVAANLQGQLNLYTQETFKTLQDKMQEFGLINRREANLDGADTTDVITSDFIPSTVKTDYQNPQGLSDAGYTSLRDMLMDYHLNIEMSKRTVNQIFDGDIATGIKSAVEFYKRNKSGVISGISSKKGFFNTAVTENLQLDINEEDLTELTKDVTAETPNSRKKDQADGQSYHTLNHRMWLLDSYGRLDPEARALLNKYKYKNLTNEEVKTLEGKKIILNSLKTATGGILEYYKLSEHLISRVDVSHMIIPPGKTREEIEGLLDEFYTEIQALEELLSEDPNYARAEAVETELQNLYSRIHQYWEPKRGREKLHFALNSMELSNVHQLFDPNASKKTTLVPVKLSSDSVTNLRPSRSATTGLFKFMQVETSGIHDHITLPSQARQLLTTYINKLDDKTYKNVSLKQLAEEYAKTLGEITSSSFNNLQLGITDVSGELNITQVFEAMYDGLKKQGADSNTLKFFEVRDGKPVHDPNLPLIKRQFTYYYFALFNDAVFSKSVKGRSDILVSDYGYEVLYDTLDNDRIITQAEQEANPEEYRDQDRYKTRHLGISVERKNGKNIYSVEVIVPKPLIDKPAELQLYLDRVLDKFFSTRIPTEDRRSMFVAKPVDFIDNVYQNSIIVPHLVHVLAGSDLDIDKLYSHVIDYYLDYSGQPHVYGDYSNYATPSQGRFAEYILYMTRNREIQALVEREAEKIEASGEFSKDFYKVAEELGISTTDLSVDDLKNRRFAIRLDIEDLEKNKKALQEQHDMLFNEYLNSGKTREAKGSWLQKRVDYLIAKDAFDSAKAELREIREELNKVENTYRIAAVLNVLKKRNMPVTQSGLTQYLATNPTPVIPVLDNISLQQKIDVLSNEKVFKDYYIKERSTVQPFIDVAQSIGASVESIVNQNSIYSVMGDIVANDLNSSNKDGIGIAASFNKFLAFAEKNNLQLAFNAINVIDENGKPVKLSNFLNTEGIRKIGQTLGMFADAAKNPIPSVLNLNPDTAGFSNTVVGLSGNLELALLLNKVPFVEQIITDYRNTDRSAVVTAGQYSRGLKGMFTGAFKDRVGILGKENRLTELFKVNSKNQITGELRDIYFKKVEPKLSEIGLAALGIELYYEDGSRVKEDVAEAYIASVYMTLKKISDDMLRLGKILNLIKNQKPSFIELNEIMEAVEYFKTPLSVFGDSVGKILEKSPEYAPLIKAATAMDKYSRQLMIERSPLFNDVVKTVFSGLSNTSSKDERAIQNITDQIGKYILINKIKFGMQADLKKLEGKTDPVSTRKKDILQSALDYFTADFWLKNNNLEDELDYLYEKNPGNAFVEFLKINNRKGIKYLESASRMKLDQGVTEDIINGFEALQKSRDPRTVKFSAQLFYYTLVKDGLGYGAFSFVKYINPDMYMFKDASGALKDLVKLLLTQEKFVTEMRKKIIDINKSGLNNKEKVDRIDEINDKIRANYNKLFDEYFGTDAAGKTEWIDLLTDKIFSYAGNQKYIRETDVNLKKRKNTEDIKPRLAKIIEAGVFSHIESSAVLKNKEGVFNDVTTDQDVFTVDYSKVAGNVELVNSLPDLFRHDMFNIIDDQLVSVEFKALKKDRKGNMFKLASVKQGMIATYKRLNPEGTDRLLNFGFSTQDGRALFEHVNNFGKEVEDEGALDLTDPRLVKDNSDNVLKDPIEVSEEAYEVGQEIGEEDIDALLASGKYYSSRKKKAGQKTTQAAQPAAQSATEQTGVKTYKGKIETLQPNQVFVFGSNPLGINGNPEKYPGMSASVATKNGWVQQGEKMDNRLSDSGKAWGLTTVTGPGRQKSMSTKQIQDGITKLYAHAKVNPGQEFLVAYTATARNNNGYTAQEMAAMFSSTEIPSNMVFEEGFSKLLTSSAAAQSTAKPQANQDKTITYTPIGKTEQTYTIRGNQVFNKDGKEVFREDSKDRNRIFANLAVKEGRAVVVSWKNNSYVVNNKDQIISVKTGDIMQWGQENGDRKGILQEAKKKFAAQSSVPADVNTITTADIDKIYNNKADKKVTLEQFRQKAQGFIQALQAAGIPNSEILEQLQCL